MKILDWFLNRKKYTGKQLILKERYKVSKEEAYDGIATVYYDILDLNNYYVGTIDLRLSIDDEMYYYGNVGYRIFPKYRGHHYAYFACLLLFEVAKSEYDLKELIITCSPDNIASYKTLNRLNGELLELAEVPRTHPLYLRGETQKYIFRYKINL